MWTQNENIEVTNCQTGAALSGVYVVDGNGRLLATSDTSGHCHFTLDKWPLFLKRQGLRPLAIYEPADLKQHICLVPVKYKLPTVAIKAKKENLQKYLLKLRDKNLPWFIAHDTTTYYKFSYSLQFPGKNWEEKATGYIAYRWRHHKSILTEIDFLQYHYSCSDTGFWKSKYYQAVHPDGIYHVLHYNLMGNDAGYELWDKLVNKEGLRIPIPAFLVSKRKRKLMKNVTDDPVKYHLSQYGSEKRRLTLQFDTAKDKVFYVHYSDYDTSDYISEKLVFDSSDRLKSVYYYTPENLSTNYFSLDSATINNISRDSKINNNSSYYYSDYTYDVQHKPILRKEARHLELFYVDGQHYRVSVRLSLTKAVPRKDFAVNAYYWKGGRMNGAFVGLEKGQEVLNAINNLTNLKPQSKAHKK